MAAPEAMFCATHLPVRKATHHVCYDAVLASFLHACLCISNLSSGWKWEFILQINKLSVDSVHQTRCAASQVEKSGRSQVGGWGVGGSRRLVFPCKASTDVTRVDSTAAGVVTVQSFVLFFFCPLSSSPDSLGLRNS